LTQVKGVVSRIGGKGNYLEGKTMGSCQMCGSEVEHLNRSTDGVKMCDYCYKSLIGRWIECKGKNADIGRTLAQCFNVLEQRLKSKDK